MKLAARLASFLAAALLCACAPAVAQDWPARPVRWILPNSAGSGPDTVARVVADKLERIVGQPFVIDNRPGANFFIAAQAIARAEPDGYTIGLGSGIIHSINPHLFRSLPYDPDRDFDFIGMMIDTVWTVVGTHASSPAKSFDELIAIAKANPGKLTFQSTVQINIMWFKWINSKLGARMTDIQYKSAPQGVQDQLAGRTDLFVNSVTGFLPHIKAGKIRVLAISPDTPFPGLESVPRITKWVPGGSLETWISIMGPKGMPAPMVQKLNRAIDAVVKDEEVKKRLLDVGWANAQGARTPEAIARLAHSERERWGEIVREAGVQPQ